MFIFPGMGLGVVAARATHVTDYLFYVAARRLAECVAESDLNQGKVGGVFRPEVTAQRFANSYFFAPVSLLPTMCTRRDHFFLPNFPFTLVILCPHALQMSPAGVSPHL